MRLSCSLPWSLPLEASLLPPISDQSAAGLPMLNTKHCQWPGPREALRELYGEKHCPTEGEGGVHQEKESCAEPMCGFHTHEKALEVLGVLCANGHSTRKGEQRLR